MAILLLTNVRWDVTLKECQGFFPSALNKQKKGQEKESSLRTTRFQLSFPWHILEEE